MRTRATERKELSRMVEERYRSRDLVKVGQRAKLGTKGTARAVGKNLLCSCQNLKG